MNTAKNVKANQLEKFGNKCQNQLGFINTLFGTCGNIDLAKNIPEDNLDQLNVNEHCTNEVQKMDIDGLAGERLTLNSHQHDFNINTSLDIEIKKINKPFILTKDDFETFRVKMQNIIADLSLKFKTIKNVIHFFKLLATFSFIFVFINSYKYFSSFMKKLDHDNTNITQYFRHIDARRFRDDKRTLLPLKKTEKSNLNYPLELFVSAYQKPVIKLNIFIHVTFIILILVSLITDHALTDFLLILTNNTLINYKLQTVTENEFSICGNGLMSKLLQGITDESIDNSHNSTQEFSNAVCLFKVGQLTHSQVKTLVIQFILLNIAILFELYVKRLNKFICALFYRKWEKKRIVWLYNDLLKKRKSFIQNCKIKVNFKKKNHKLNSLKAKNFIAKLKEWIFNDKHCVLCESMRRDNSVECLKCQIVYCIECWLDLEEKCVGCVPDYFLYEENNLSDNEENISKKKT